MPIRKGRITPEDQINLSGANTISTPNLLVRADGNGKIDTNWLKMNEIIPPGTVVAYAGSTPPQGWLLCNGAAVSRTFYANLFAAIGTAHGIGDGFTTFNIPDYRGRFLRMVDGVAGRDPDASTRTAMNLGGNVGNSVGSVQLDELRSHNHQMAQDTRNFYNSSPWDDPGYIYTGPGVYTTNTGGNETRPINAYVNYIIKF